jgi:hypothetical protein
LKHEVPLISHNAQSFIHVVIIIIINLIITRMPVRKIDAEEFLSSPSARNGAVTEGDADCRQILSVYVPLDGCAVSFTPGTVSSSNASELQKETDCD